MPSLRDKPLQFQHFNVSFPAEHVVQVTINRPDKLNCINKATSREIADIWERLDQDESLWVGIITGVGRAFCTGADLHGKCSEGGECVLHRRLQIFYQIKRKDKRPRLTREQSGTP
jgi:enoyl-CoA hydratase/carnithine racemase